MLEKALLLLLISLSPLSTWAAFPAMDDPQSVIEWNVDTDQVGGAHVSVDRVAFDQLAEMYFKVPDNMYFKLTEKSSLTDFYSTLKTALSQFTASGPGTLRIFLNSHGDIDKFWAQNESEPVSYADFAQAIANAVTTAPAAPKSIELYLDPCYSGTAIKYLDQYLQKQQVRGALVTAWTGSSSVDPTWVPEYADAIDAFEKVNFSLSSILGLSDSSPENIFQGLGGISHGQLWTNSGENYQPLTPTDLQKLIKTDQPFFQERALISSIENHEASPDIAPDVVAILNNPNNDYYLRSISAEYLGQLRSNGPAEIALLKAAQKGGLVNDQSESIRGAVVEAVGFADPDAADVLIQIAQNTSEQKFIRAQAIQGLGATKSPAAVPLINSLIDSTDLQIRDAAWVAYIRAEPDLALSYFSSQLAGSSLDGATGRYAIYIALCTKPEPYIGDCNIESPAIARQAAQLLTQEYQRVTGDQQMWVVEEMGRLAEGNPFAKAELLQTMNGALQQFLSTQADGTEQYFEYELTKLKLESGN